MTNPILLAGSVYELRVPNPSQGVVSGYFEDAQQLYQAATTLDGKVPGLYVTLNPVNPALLARANNRIRPRATKTTSDADILHRAWLLIDCDPKRPAEISSTESEHQAALERCEAVARWLTDRGWPAPVSADSGNGGHLLYRVALPNDADSTQLVKACLEALAFNFDDERVVIDTSVHNAARITKLYGTMTRKGDPIQDRPYRRSAILSVPDPVEIVSPAQLHELGQCRLRESSSTHRRRSPATFHVDAFTQEHKLEIVQKKSWQNASVFVLAHCPFNEEHARSSSLIQFPDGVVMFHCFHNSCQSYRGKDVRTLLKSAHGHDAPLSSSPAISKVEYELITADSVEMKPVKWAIEGRVPLGMLTVLAGRGGLGKSTIAVEWAAQLTRGTAPGAFFGVPTPIIISSTEDTEEQILVPRFAAAKADMSKVHFIRVRRDGLAGSLTIPDDLTRLHDAITKTQAKLLIIDPLMAHLSSTLDSWKDQQIRQALTPLSQMAEELQVAVLVNAHLNKDTKKDALDRIGGSVGIANSARSVLFVGPDPDDPEGPTKILAHPKCNVGAKQPALRYRTEMVRFEKGAESIETTRIVWEGDAPGVTAEDLVCKPESVSRDDRSRATEWLKGALLEGQRRKQSDIQAEATKAGITIWALNRAKAALQVQSKKEGFHHSEWWWWREAPPPESALLLPSGEIAPNPLKYSKACEGSTPAPLVRSSPFEDCTQSGSAPFVLPSQISTTYDTAAPKIAARGSHEGEGPTQS